MRIMKVMHAILCFVLMLSCGAFSATAIPSALRAEGWQSWRNAVDAEVRSPYALQTRTPGPRIKEVVPADLGLQEFGALNLARDLKHGGTMVSQAREQEPRQTLHLPGDLNHDGTVDCRDIKIVKDALNTKRGEPAFDARADTNNDGVVDVRDLAFVAQQLPAGTRCP